MPGGVSADSRAIFIGIATALTWACYTIAIAPLMGATRRTGSARSCSRIGWMPLALVSIPQISTQQFSFGWRVWLGFGYAVIGPLFLTNILWFTAMSIVGAARASLFNNLQPFFGVVFAVLLLSEKLRPLEIGGGLLIFAGIALERLRRRDLVDPMPRGRDAPEADVREAVGNSDVAATSFMPLTQRQASCSFEVCPHQTFTPASWKLFSIPARHEPLNGAAMNTISRPALSAKKIRNGPSCVHRL